MHGTSSDFPLTAAYWKLGLLHSGDLVRIAVEALQAGFDSPALRILAGEDDRSSFFEVGPLFDRVLRELDIAVPSSEEEAARHIALHHARRIVTGEVSPWEGAHAIELEIYYIFHSDRPEWLMPIMAQAFQHEDFQVYAKTGFFYGRERAGQILTKIEAEIVKAAEQLVNTWSSPPENANADHAEREKKM